MRYFDTNLVANSRPHSAWWDELSADREWFHNTEGNLAAARNAQVMLPRDAWVEFDNITRRIMRADTASFMIDLMPLAKPIHIGKLVHMTRVAGDAGTVVRSMSGQAAVPLDKVAYDYRGAPVPIFATGYGREWREWNTLQSENFDALADDQEAHSVKLRDDQADYVLNGDLTISVEGYKGYGILNNPLAKAINLGTAVGGAAIDLTSAAVTSDQIEAFVNGVLGSAMDANKINVGINLYVSPEIMRNLDRPYSGSAGNKVGSLRDALVANRRINKIEQTFALTGNAFFAFVPSSEYIRPLIGMASNTTAKTRINPTDNYQFMIMGAMGLEIRTDWAGHTGVFYSTVVNA